MKEKEKPKRDWHRAYFSKNRFFNVRIPETLYLWFLDYMQETCTGTTTAEQFRDFLLRVQKCYEKGILIPSMKDIKHADIPKPLEKPNKYLGIAPELICVRNLNLKNMQPDSIESACHFCKNVHPSAFQACQEIRKEQEEAKTQ